MPCSGCSALHGVNSNFLKNNGFDSFHEKTSPSPQNKAMVWSKSGRSISLNIVIYLHLKFDLTKSLEWDYKKVHQGTGPLDRVGGSLKKNLAFRAVKSEKRVSKNSRL